MSLPILQPLSASRSIPGPSTPSGGSLATMRALGTMAGNVLRTKLIGRHSLLRPLFMSWEINSACNLRCPYCYIHDRSYGFSDRGLRFEEMKRALARIKRATPDLLLLGGEPFLHPAWDDIVDHCNDALGLRVRCITNGTLLEAHLRTTGRLHLLAVSYDQTRERVYPEKMADMRRQLTLVAATYPRLTILIIFVICAEDDPAWVVEQIHEMTEQGYNVHINVDREIGEAPVDPRIVQALREAKRRTGRVHMTDVTLDWLEDITQPLPYCNPTLMPLLDPRARLIYPCCYYNEQSAGSLLEMDYAALLRKSAERFGRYPFDKCATCKTTAYLDAAVSVRSPGQGIRHYHSLYNR